MPEKELKEGMFLRFVGDKTPDALIPLFYKVIASEGFEYKFPFSAAVASGGESGFINVENLEPDDRPMHLFYVLWGIRDGCGYQIKIPTGTDRLGVDEDKDVARITNRHNPHYAPDPLYAFYIISDMYPAINAVNNTPASVTPEIYFMGEKYDLEIVDDDEILKRLNNFEKRESPWIPSENITLGGVA